MYISSLDFLYRTQPLLAKLYLALRSLELQYSSSPHLAIPSQFNEGRYHRSCERFKGSDSNLHAYLFYFRGIPRLGVTFKYVKKQVVDLSNCNNLHGTEAHRVADRLSCLLSA